MITLLETLLDGADGAYANSQDLRNLEHVMSSWAERKTAYLAVQSNESTIIDRAMKLMETSKDFPDARKMNELRLTQCRRDITLALRYYALGMLMQDEAMLKDRFIYWQKNILQAMGLHHYNGVHFVLEALCLELPPEQANLFKPYFKLGQELISAK
jgi:Phycobilisome protein